MGGQSGQSGQGSQGGQSGMGGKSQGSDLPGTSKDPTGQVVSDKNRQNQGSDGGRSGSQIEFRIAEALIET